MPAITYSDFSGGLDRRLPINVQEANRLWLLTNAYITLGKRIKKRPALTIIANGLTGSYGLEAVNGRLKVFTDAGSAFVAPGDVDKVELNVPAWLAGQTLARIHYADIFSGYVYAVAEYSGGTCAHHYVDASGNTVITDVNNPRSISVTKAASRVFAISGETVRYCAAGAPRDWTTASNAGFLPASLQQNTKGPTTGVGMFQNKLVVFFDEGAQIWTVAVDPSANAITKLIEGVGTSHPLAGAGFANDFMFLSPFGFRSMQTQALSDRIDDTDVGVAVDDLVVADIAASSGSASPPIFGLWIHQLGQYWAFFDNGSSTKAWVYSFSKSGKLACWSMYTLAVRVTAVTTLKGKVYARSADALYELSALGYADHAYTVANGVVVTAIPVEVQMAFQDAKRPGVNKQFYGADFALAGSWAVAYKYDARDQAKETIPQTLSSDTRPGDMVPVEVVAAAIAPVFRHSADEAAEIDLLTLYYNVLGTSG